jgi:hypothetical protein
MTDLFGKEMDGAMFSEDRKHRYALWRIWDDAKPLLMVIGLNPSQGDETRLDQTLHKVRNFAQHWGYGGFYMMNLFSYVSTDPNQLVTCKDNTYNDSWLCTVSKSCRDVVFAWGRFDQAKQRCQEVIKMFPDAYAFRLNKDGSPQHPLLIPRTTKLIPFNK